MLPRIVTSNFLDALLRPLVTPPSAAGSSAGPLRCKPPCRPRLGFPLRYGTRYITLHLFLRQAVRFFSDHAEQSFTINTLVSLQQMVRFGQNPSQGTLLRASQFLLGTCHYQLSPLYHPANFLHGKRSSQSDWRTVPKNSMNFLTI